MAELASTVSAEEDQLLQLVQAAPVSSVVIVGQKVSRHRQTRLNKDFALDCRALVLHHRASRSRWRPSGLVDLELGDLEETLGMSPSCFPSGPCTWQRSR